MFVEKQQQQHQRKKDEQNRTSFSINVNEQTVLFWDLMAVFMGSLKYFFVTFDFSELKLNVVCLFLVICDFKCHLKFNFHSHRNSINVL